MQGDFRIINNKQILISMAQFYQAALIRIDDVIEHVKLPKGTTLEERLGTPEGECPECGGKEWWLYPKRSSIVIQGGKPYCECLECGYLTHL